MGSSSQSDARQAAAWQPGDEPLPGYRLLEPLGHGGFGEVWKCEVSGGLHKAIKVVGNRAGGGRHSLADVELRALQRIRAIRHPYLLSIERVEQIAGQLLVVMELADQNLYRVLLDHQADRKAGLPREMLLRLMREAAEVLDLLHFEHGLQHLDIKPHNLFLVSQHIKVADFGLVSSMADPVTSSAQGAGTPLYIAPERIQGQVSPQSDQYSLAIVYQQMLTGTVPFFSHNTYELMTMHLTGQPDLSALPLLDRLTIQRALSKNPAHRFPSCVALVESLSRSSGRAASLPARRPTDSIPPGRVPGSAVEQTRVMHEQQKTPPPACAAAPSQSLPGGVPAGVGRNVRKAPDRQQASGRLSLPGYDLLTLHASNRLSEVWTVRDPGGVERLAHCLLVQSERDRETLAKLQQIRHPILARSEAFLSPSGRLVVITDRDLPPLRARLEACQREGQRGIPRAEVLSHLRRLAEGLDVLRERTGLQHLGLSPTSLLLLKDRLVVRDFGLLALCWVPTGLPVAQVTSRYAAPELWQPGHAPTSDQYSLALIYTELLTGLPPRSVRGGGRSGGTRRPDLDTPGREGVTSAGGVNGSPPPARLTAAARIDLDLLPSYDRVIIDRALSEDPAGRYGSCVELIAALERAPAAHFEEMARRTALTPVMSVDALLGKGGAAPAPHPAPRQLIQGVLQGLTGKTTFSSEDVRSSLGQAGKWVGRFHVMLVADTLRLRLEGFRSEWHAEMTRPADPEQIAMRVVTRKTPQGFLRRTVLEEGLVIRVLPDPTSRVGPLVGEVVVDVELFGAAPGAWDSATLAAVTPLVEGLRSYLQPVSDQRDCSRWPFPQSLNVYFLAGSTPLSVPVKARGKNLSLTGIGFLMPQEPPGNHLYVHLHEDPTLARLALEAQVTRVQPLSGGWYEVGAAFMADDDPPCPTS